MKKPKDHFHKSIYETCEFCGIELEENFWNKERIIKIIGGAILFLIGLYLEFFTSFTFVSQLIFLGVIALVGRGIIKNAIRNLKKLKFDMNVLMSIAALGAFLIGHGEEGTAVIYLFYIAESLEGYAITKARKSIKELLDLAPPIARVKRKKVINVDVGSVKEGEIIIVKPGEKIPLDGIVVEGSSYVNQSPITGESVPVFKKKGDKVFGGTLNEEGYLEIKVTNKAGDTVLDRIVKVLSQAQKNKSKTEKFIDKFSKYYTPLVITLALIVMSVPPLIFGGSFEEWLYRGLVLLVVACPCALAISTPVSIVSSLTSSAKKGVLVKGGVYLEEIKNAKVFVFDKTGTLTKGELKVMDVVSFENEEKLWNIVYSLEKKASHPIAQALFKEAEKRGAKSLKVSSFKTLVGKGVRGTISGKTYYIGNREPFKLNKKVEEIMREMENEGKTAILVGTKTKILGVIGVMDEVRETSKEVIDKLKARGIKCIMLTGDNERVAKAIAKKLGIDYFASLLPEDKVRIVEDLLKKEKHVVMVGDGVNDALALQKAHVGIAMGKGSDVAIETADVVLMKDDLRKINYLLKLSEKTLEVMKQNIAASILIKGSLGLMAFFGIVSLWLAVAIGDVGLSIAVIGNALRLGKVKD